MRYRLIVLSLLLCLATPATAQVSVSIGINVPVYPALVPVPGYPVYYAPSLSANYFFYDGMYWVYDGDNWHTSFWYNGPWRLVAPLAVPVYVLRVPVRYYRVPPPYFRRWRQDAPPRWGEHWGQEWERHRSGWDRWERRSVPPPAPLPTYQRQYSGDRYPRTEQKQQELASRNYRHQPRDPAVREHYQQARTQAAPAPADQSRQPAEPRQKPPRQREQSAPPPPQERSAAPPTPPQRAQEVPRSQPPQREREGTERPPPSPRAGPPVQHEPQSPKSDQAHDPRGKGAAPQAKAPPHRGEAKGDGKGEANGHERDK